VFCRRKWREVSKKSPAIFSSRLVSTMNPFATHESLATSELVLRLLTAFVCGATIGLNREFHRKPAGFRTFGLVSIGSAVVVLVIEQTLGAGVILHRAPNRKLVAGLTTSAAIWLTAGLGMAAGAGQHLLAFIGLAFAMALLLLGGPFERLLERIFRYGKRGPEGNPRIAEDPPD